MKFITFFHACRGLQLLALLTLGLFSLGALAAPTEITHCGQIVTTDAVMTSDLVCKPGIYEAIAIEINASNITLDMGGYILSGDAFGIGVRAMDVEGVKIKDGTIENFLSGLDLVRAPGATVEGLTIRNLEIDDPDNFVPGMRIVRSQNVLVKDCFFEMLPVAHKEMIVMASSQATITNNEFKNGSVGVNVSRDGDLGSIGSIASVINNHFIGVTIAGVLVQFTENVRIANNEFTQCEMGVMADLHADLGDASLSDITIEGNHMHDGYIGIHFMGITDSGILRNTIRDNWRGIFIDSTMGCPEPPTPECIFSSDNLVSGNITLGNFIDLFHREEAVGNTWENNKCQIKEGAEIPECTVLYLDGFEY